MQIACGEWGSCRERTGDFLGEFRAPGETPTRVDSPGLTGQLSYRITSNYVAGGKMSSLDLPVNPRLSQLRVPGRGGPRR